MLSRKASPESLDSSENQESPGAGHASSESIIPPGTNQESAGLDHKDVQESILEELPSLDSVAAEGINTHEIPTFNEFHAMVSERSQSRKGQGSCVSVLFVNYRILISAISREAVSLLLY